MKTKILMFCFPLRHSFDIERLMGWKTAQLIAESNTDIKIITTYNCKEPFQLHHRIEVLKPFENWNFKSLPNLIKLILKFPNYIIHFNWSDDLSTIPLNFLLSLKSSLPLKTKQKSIIAKWSLNDSTSFNKLVNKWSHELELIYSHDHQILNSLKIHEHKIHFFDTSLVKNNSKPTLESEICITPDKYIFLPITNLKNLQSNKYQHLFKKLLEFNSDNKIVLTIDTSHLSHKKYWNLKSILTEYQLLDKVEFIPMTTVNFQFLITRSILTVLDLENLSENEYHFLKFTCIQNSSKYFEFNKANIDSHSIHKLFDHIITSNKTDNYDEISKFNYIDQITNKFLKIYSQASG